MSTNSSAHDGAVRPSLPALLSTVLLLMACCVREGHSHPQPHPGLSIPLAHGEAPRLRARSQQHLKTWAINERLRINGKYGDIALGTSSLEGGSSNSNKRSNSKPKKAKRQSSTGNTSTSITRGSSGTTTAPPTSGGSSTRSAFSASTTGLNGGSSNTARSPLGRTNLTNYQSDLCVDLIHNATCHPAIGLLAFPAVMAVEVALA